MLNWFRGLGGALNVVMVTTRTGTSIKGLLVERARNGVVLRAASVGSLDHNNVATWERMGGDIVIPIENIDYWQENLPPEVLE
jgi:hypothetical protein